MRSRAVECGTLAAVVADNPVRYHRRNAAVGCLLSRMPDQPSDRHPHLGPPPARIGREPCDRLSVFMVSRLRADAGADRIARGAARR